MSRDSLWDHAAATYARPGVEAALLELQDAHGQSAPLLLWALWLAAAGRSPSRETLAEAAALARRWEDEATGPLRALRRRLKDAARDAMAVSRAALREKVEALELEAERALLERL
ncbi:MAG: TIGR02444 family protein, partial [Caulobacteraceae bacterium]